MKDRMKRAVTVFIVAIALVTTGVHYCHVWAQSDVASEKNGGISAKTDENSDS